MELIYHSEICQKAIGTHFSEKTLEIIIAANHKQDGLFTGLVGHPEYHFDDNKFDDSCAFVNEQHLIVRKSISLSDLESAWIAFGRLLHAVQDYYSHSNYIKLWMDTYSPGKLPILKDFSGVDETILNSDELYTARVYYPLEALTYFEFMRPILRPVLPADSHANMNLDSPIMGELFPYAMEGARHRSEFEYKKIIEKFDSDKIRKFHGK